MNIHYHLLISALLTALISPSAVNADVYKWVDEKGNTQFSDTPPPDKPFEEKAYQTKSPDLDPEMQEHRRRLKLNAVERQRAEEYNKKINTQKAQEAKKRKHNCNNLKSRMLMGQKITGWQTKNPDGTVTRWSGEQNKQYAKLMQENYKKYCE